MVTLLEYRCDLAISIAIHHSSNISIELVGVLLSHAMENAPDFTIVVGSARSFWLLNAAIYNIQ